MKTKALYELVVRKIVKYLLGTKRPRCNIQARYKSKDLEYYVDVDFAGGWQKVYKDNPENALSRTGYAIFYVKCPVIWISKLQTEIALSTAKSEYVTLSQAMRDIIPLIQLLTEINCIFPIYCPTPQIKCKVFEDDESCIFLQRHKSSLQELDTLQSNTIISDILWINKILILYPLTPLSKLQIYLQSH